MTTLDPTRRRAWVDACAAGGSWPLPGSGATEERWRRLAEVAEADLVVGRLTEAHADADAILAELGGSRPAPGERWGVWAAGDPGALRATTVDGRAVLDGVRPWCSGATLCTHALVVAGDTLFAVDLAQAAVQPGPASWTGRGMQGCDTRTVCFSGATAVPVGLAGSYLDRPGFWMGAIGVAACWHGGAEHLARRLARGARERNDAHTLAHLGAVSALVLQSGAVLAAAARRIDDEPRVRHRGLALATRSVVERSATEIIDRIGRALGPAPLALEAAHDELVADLGVYLRQHHAERDLEQIGRALLEDGDGW